MADTNSKLKLHQASVQPFVMLCIVTFSVMKVPCDANIVLNCTRPDPPALLEALQPVFNMSAIRPVLHMSTPTNVTMYFTLHGILGVDEKAQLLTTYIWVHVYWENEFFSWDPVQCGADRISLPRNKFWVPDMVINEFMDENKAPFVPYVRAFHNGTIQDQAPIRVVSSCHLEIYTFPFDVQNCTLTFNAFMYPDHEVRMELGKTVELILEASREVMTSMGEWELMDITYTKVFDGLAFHIQLRRRASLYVVNLIIPSCFLITVDLFSFLLPPQSSDRSSFKMTLILGYTVFLLMMNDLLPVTGNDIPLINVFFCLCLALMVASLLETILITNLLCDSSWNLTPVPRWVQVLVLHMLGSLVGLPPKPKDKTNSEGKACPLVAVEGKADDQAEAPEAQGPEVEDKALEQLRSLGKDLQAIRLQVEQHLTGNQSSEEWLQVGFIIDRLLFIFYIIFISVSVITIIYIWASSYAADMSI